MNSISISMASVLILTSLFGFTFTKTNVLVGAEFKLLLMVSAFLALVLMNLMSLVCYSFPMTTVTGMNLTLALFFWGATLLVTMVRPSFISSALPLHTPSYLMAFLSVVELVSVSVRPITLSFRLLANISAGHILLTLVCKLSNVLWISGILLCLLELLVCVIQGFVFLMLVNVYMEESFSH